MEMEIYADLFFLVNFSMDFAALLAVGAILRGKVRLGWVALAAAAGGLYSVLRLLLPESFPLSLLTDLGVGFLLCYLSFGFSGIWRFLLAGAAFYGVSFLLGGAVTATYGFLRSRRLLLPGDSAAGILLPAAFLTAGGAALLSRALRRETDCLSVEMTLYLPEGTRACLEGLLDTGSLVREPLSGLPAVILSRSFALRALPEEVFAALLAPTAEQRPATLPPAWQTAFRLLPVKTLEGEGLLPAFLGEGVCAGRKGDRRRLCVAVDLRECGRGPYGGFEGIVPRCLTEKTA